MCIDAEFDRGLGLEYTHMDVAIADDGDGMPRLWRTMIECGGPTSVIVIRVRTIYMRVGVDADTGRVNTWLLGSEAGYMPLLRFAISRETYADAMAAVVVDMSRPWLLMDDVQVCGWVFRVRAVHVMLSARGHAAGVLTSLIAAY